MIFCQQKPAASRWPQYSKRYELWGVVRKTTLPESNPLAESEGIIVGHSHSFPAAAAAAARAASAPEAGDKEPEAMKSLHGAAEGQVRGAFEFQRLICSMIEYLLVTSSSGKRVCE
jgi:hypothetical protein